MSLFSQESPLLWVLWPRDPSHSLIRSLPVTRCVPLCFLFLWLTHSLALYLLLHLSSLKLFVVELLSFCLVCVVTIVMSCSSSSDTKITVVSQLLDLNHTCCQSNLPWMSQLCAVCCLRRVLYCESYGREIPLTHPLTHSLLITLSLCFFSLFFFFLFFFSLIFFLLLMLLLLLLFCCHCCIFSVDNILILTAIIKLCFCGYVILFFWIFIYAMLVWHPSTLSRPLQCARRLCNTIAWRALFGAWVVSWALRVRRNPGVPSGKLAFCFCIFFLFNPFSTVMMLFFFVVVVFSSAVSCYFCFCLDSSFKCFIGHHS